MISQKAVKRKTTPAKAGTAVLEVEDRRRMARLVGKVEGDAKRAEKRRYQEACIREGHLTNCLSKARTAGQARKILWLFSTNMPVSDPCLLGTSLRDVSRSHMLLARLPQGQLSRGL